MIKSERLYSNGCGGIAFPINGTGCENASFRFSSSRHN
nr:MAG TPA: hypothetical protein [Caudoviricetes sp.]